MRPSPSALCLSLLIQVCAPALAAPVQPRSVIILIADGGGFNTWAATSMYHGRVGRQIVDTPEWTRLAVSTYPLRAAPDKPVPGAPGLAQEPEAAYQPDRAWDVTPAEGKTGDYPDYFAGYLWHKRTRPDSANTASAIMTGVKSYNGAINVDGNGTPQTTLPQLAKKTGRRVGVVSTVPIPHATVAAAAGAHHISRNAYVALSTEMLNAGVCDVIIGAGHPEFDENGAPRTPDSEARYQYVGGHRSWDTLVAGTHPAGWKLLDNESEFATFLRGPTPDKLLGVLPVSPTAQQERRSSGDPKVLPPGSDPKTPGIPTLPTTARVALNALDDSPAGFFLMIEGGAVDWAMHANQLGRMIEEHSEFIETVETVSAFLDEGASGWNWSNTLVIVTADHDHLLWGPRSDKIGFEPLEDRGPGVLPGAIWHSDSHSNQLVPLFARGLGSERLAELATRTDEVKLPDGRTLGRGKYLDQTDIHTAIHGLLSE